MRFNLDCARALLLALESDLQFDDDLEYPALSFWDVCDTPTMSAYSKADIYYTTLKLDEAGFIDVAIEDSGDRPSEIIYSSITFDGHQYLDSVRSETLWEQIKHKISIFGGSVALPIINSLSASIIKSQLGL